MKKLFFCLSLVYITNIVSQTPYELFNSKSEFFFNQSDRFEELNGLKVDSILIVGIDTIYYHYRVLGQKPGIIGSCVYSANSPSWLGYTTNRNPANEYVFFNQDHDSIIIKPSLPLYSSWIFYNYSNGDYIKATISSKQYESTYNGLFDTVKTISFQAYDNSNTPILNNYNTKTFKVAKTNGIIKMGKLYYFPLDTSINTRCFGKLLSVGDLTNHSIGDILQTYHYSGNYSNNPNATVIETFKTYSYLTKTNPTSNSVLYTVNLTIQTNTLAPVSGSSTSVSTQTILVTKLDSLVVSQMPQQYFDFNPNSIGSMGTVVNYYYNPFLINNSCDNLRVKYINCIMYGGTSDTCLGPSVSCPQPSYKTLIKDLQSDAYGYNESIFTSSYPNQPQYNSYPIYLNSLNQTCGSMIVLGIEKNNTLAKIKIYPNPSNNSLFIDFPTSEEDLEVKIIDLMSNELMNVKLTPDSLINVSDLTSGIYFITVKTSTTEFKQKFIKE